MAVLIIMLLMQIIEGEILTFDASNPSPNVIQCVDDSDECIINCVSNNACSSKQIHCHQISSKKCIINLIGINSGRTAYIYTHQSQIIYINAIGSTSCYDTEIHAYQRMGAKLFIYSKTASALNVAIIYGPVGEGSLLSMECFHSSCRSMKIYDDWTTQVYMQPFGGTHQFYSSIVKNIFDNSTLNISRTDSNYIGLNTAYRASVFLNNCDKSDNAFRSFKYYGNNHGNWTIVSNGEYAFYQSFIYATSNIPTYNGLSGYNIKLIGSFGDTTDDTLIDNDVLSFMTIDANQDGANIYAQITHDNGLRFSNIYARKANSVNIYCHQGGDCNNLLVECPENNQINSCKILCEDTTTNCMFIQMYTTNGYCKDAVLLCVSDDCTLGTTISDGAKIYCGYDQTADYCQLIKDSSGKYVCYDFGIGSCSNNYTEETCHDITTEAPIATFYSIEAICNEFPTTEPTEDPSSIPTEIPTLLPSETPSMRPTISPTNPSMHPSSIPTNPLIPTNNPTDTPTIELQGEVIEVQTTNQSNVIVRNVNGFQSGSDNNNWYMILAIMAGLVCCLILIFIYKVNRKKEKISQLDTNDNMMDDVCPTSVVELDSMKQTTNSEARLKQNEYKRDKEEAQIMENITLGMEQLLVMGNNNDNKLKQNISRDSFVVIDEDEMNTEGNDSETDLNNDDGLRNNEIINDIVQLNQEIQQTLI